MILVIAGLSHALEKNLKSVKIVQKNISFKRQEKDSLDDDAR